MARDASRGFGYHAGAMSADLSFDDYSSIFARHGCPAGKYLRKGYRRFLATRRLLMEAAAVSAPGPRMLDVGAHCLHQSVLYAMDGFRVTAADMTSVIGNPAVRAVAGEFGIRLIEYADLSVPLELDELPADSFDIILFAEILEHITFNPVAMWKSLYRLLSPGGLVVVTTPNYFGRRGGRFAKDMLNVLLLRGAGPSVRDILEVNTYGHHWRLYSARDIREYFRVLSPDFSVRRVAHFETGRDRSGIARLAKRRMRQAVPLFRDALYVEIVLARKQAGITVRPHW